VLNNYKVYVFFFLLVVAKSMLKSSFETWVVLHLMLFHAFDL